MEKCLSCFPVKCPVKGWESIIVIYIKKKKTSCEKVLLFKKISFIQ